MPGLHDVVQFLGHLRDRLYPGPVNEGVLQVMEEVDEVPGMPLMGRPKALIIFSKLRRSILPQELMFLKFAGAISSHQGGVDKL